MGDEMHSEGYVWSELSTCDLVTHDAFYFQVWREYRSVDCSQPESRDSGDKEAASASIKHLLDANRPSLLTLNQKYAAAPFRSPSQLWWVPLPAPHSVPACVSVVCVFWHLWSVGHLDYIHIKFMTPLELFFLPVSLETPLKPLLLIPCPASDRLHRTA